MPKSERNSFFDKVCLMSLAAALVFLLWFNVYLKLTDALVVNYVLLKSYGLFVSMTLTASISFYHYPAALINILILFPLIHNSIGLFGKQLKGPLQYSNLQLIVAHAYFVICLVLAALCLFGTELFENSQFNIKNGAIHNIYRNMF